MNPWQDITWQEGSVVGVPLDGIHNDIVYVNNTTTFRNPAIPLKMNQWSTIDLHNGPQWLRGQPNLPDGVKAIFVSGILVSTDNTAAISNMYCFFRPFGSKIPAVAPGVIPKWPDAGPTDPTTFANGTYVMQVIAAPGGGARSNASIWVPIVDKKFDFYWWHNQQGSFALSLNLQAYLR